MIKSNVWFLIPIKTNKYLAVKKYKQKMSNLVPKMTNNLKNGIAITNVTQLSLNTLNYLTYYSISL